MMTLSNQADFNVDSYNEDSFHKYSKLQATQFDERKPSWNYGHITQDQVEDNSKLHKLGLAVDEFDSSSVEMVYSLQTSSFVVYPERYKFHSFEIYATGD